MTPSVREVRLTRRGLAVLATVVAAVLSAAFFGARGLNAIAAPGLVALAFALVSVARLEAPRVERTLPRHGEQGSTVTVELDVVADRPFSARLVDAVDRGLAASGNVREVALGGPPVAYDLELRRRGDRTVGPAAIEARDVLGLATRPFELEGTDQLLVRPPVYPLGGPRADELVWIFGGGDDRQEFDFLRHYRRGDPLRDIHWRSSAKLPGEDLVVKQFSADEGVTSVRITAESPPGHADELAAAAASLAAHLLSAGLRVGLVTADARLEPHAGGEHRDRLLDALARTRGGLVAEADRRRADLRVSAGVEGVTVEVAATSVPFVEIAGREVSVPPHGTGPATADAGGPT